MPSLVSVSSRFSILIENKPISSMFKTYELNYFYKIYPCAHVIEACGGEGVLFNLLLALVSCVDEGFNSTVRSPGERRLVFIA